MASGGSISRVQTDSREVNQLQNNIIQGVAPILSGQLAVTSLQTGLQLTVGTNTVNHGLAQTPVGMWVVNATAYLNVAGATYSAKSVTFLCSAAATCDLLFF